MTRMVSPPPTSITISSPSQPHQSKTIPTQLDAVREACGGSPCRLTPKRPGPGKQKWGGITPGVQTRSPCSPCGQVIYVDTVKEADLFHHKPRQSVPPAGPISAPQLLRYSEIFMVLCSTAREDELVAGGLLRTLLLGAKHLVHSNDQRTCL